jgi:hypothetical protein
LRTGSGRLDGRTGQAISFPRLRGERRGRERQQQRKRACGFQAAPNSVHLLVQFSVKLAR